MKCFFGSCVSNPFGSVERLDKVVDNARPINKARFMHSCDVPDDVQADMRRFPHDYTFYQHEGIMFYEWSAIEHFFR